VNPDPNVWQMLDYVYGGDIEKCHTLVCANAESPLIASYAIGETLSVIIWDEFNRLREGDRFWYEREFCVKELTRIQSTTFADIIKRVLNVYLITPYVLETPPGYYQYFMGYQKNCRSDQGYQNIYKAIPIVARWDSQAWKCVCPDPYAYFKNHINACYCQYGYKWDNAQYKCVVDKKTVDYGDYK
jgi:hypothetical protein